MGLSKEEAYEILELPNNAAYDDVLKNYKRLSLEWYPDKHKNNPEAIEKFEKISHAVIKITAPEKYEPKSMTVAQMLSLFQQIFFGNDKFIYNAGDNSDAWEDESYESDVDIYSERLDGGDFGAQTKAVTAEEARKNAEALIAEEEREKKKAEKRKAKKKRRKEKKKLEKVLSEKQKPDDEEVNDMHSPGNSSQTEKNKKAQETSSSDSEEDIDPNSAFVAVIANKKWQQINIYNKKQEQKKKSLNCKEEKGGEESRVQRSRQLAVRGNEMANVGHYQEAIDLFTEAIKLDPSEYRFFGNRSYCYDRLEHYERALKDAEKAISLSPQWAKGHFRKGRALAGLQKYSKAEKCYEEVLRLDKECTDAVKELAKVKILQIAEMGFSRQQADAAIQQYGTVQSALDALLSGAAASMSVRADQDIFVSEDDDDDDSFVAFNSKFHHSQLPDGKMDPRNPEGHTSLWVGNVRAEITEKLLTSLFSKYGELLSVRSLPEKFCAFINYKDKFAAGKAMQALQGKEVAGVNIVIRFPDNPGKTGTVLKKSKAVSKVPEQPKQKSSGPVNGDECYFWRTTGCTFGDSCRYKHIKEHKGKDKKCWHDKNS